MDWATFHRLVDPSQRLSLEYVSRLWLFAQALGKDLAVQEAAYNVRGLAGLVEGSSAVVEAKPVPAVDHERLAEEKRKMRHKLVYAQWGGSKREQMTASVNTGEDSGDETAPAMYAARHASEILSFVEFVRFFRRVDSSDFEQQQLWSFVLFASGDEIFPGHVLELAKGCADLLSDGLVEYVKVVDGVAGFFGDRVSMGYDEWKELCLTDRFIAGRRIRHLPLTSGFWTFAFIKRRVDKMREYACLLQMEGIVVCNKRKARVRVEGGYLLISWLDERSPSPRGEQLPSPRNGPAAANEFQVNQRLASVEFVVGQKKGTFDLKFPGGPSYHFDVDTDAAVSAWQRCVNTNVVNLGATYRFESFAKEHTNVRCKWYVDGMGYFRDLLRALRAAREEIFITDWSFSPEIYLERESGDSSARLDLTLEQCAQRGVKVYILLWWESKVATAGTVNAGYVQARFKSSANIFVVLHPTGTLPSKWSHHQKGVVIDRQLAFAGGIDLCYGRYDDQSHKLCDDCHLRTRWPGKVRVHRMGSPVEAYGHDFKMVKFSPFFFRVIGLNFSRCARPPFICCRNLHSKCDGAVLDLVQLLRYRRSHC
jgi:hypothetical protein